MNRKPPVVNVVGFVTQEIEKLCVENGHDKIKRIVGVADNDEKGGLSDWAAAHNDLYDTNAILGSMQYGVQFVGTETKTQWAEVMNTYVAKIFNGEMKPSEAFTQAAKEINEILATENK